MDARITWAGQAAFDVESGSGHRIRVDGPPELGGTNAGPRPMELMLMSVGSCSAMDVVHILGKARQPVAGVEVKVSGTRAETDPKVYTDIHLHFVVSGHGLSGRQVARAVQLSAEKYCSASLMLAAGGVKVTHDHEIRSAD